MKNYYYLLLSLFCCFANLNLQALDIVLETEQLAILAEKNELKFGFKYANEAGKYKLKGILYGYKLRPKMFGLEIIGGKFNKGKQVIEIDRAFIKAHGGAFIVCYHNPYEPGMRHFDTIKIPVLQNLETVACRLNYDCIAPLLIKATFSDGFKKIYHGKDLMSMLQINEVYYEVENGTLNGLGLITTNKYKGTLDDAFISIKVKANQLEKTLYFNYNFIVNEHFSFNGTDGRKGTQGYDGVKGNNGKDIEIEVTFLKDNIFYLKITSYGFNKSFVLDATASSINIETKGGDGGDGGRGANGIDAGSYNTKYTNGGQGYTGYRGGDGGNGGNVHIIMPTSFALYLKIIAINNAAGKGGAGGNGGKGGLDFDPNKKATLLNTLLPARGPNGSTGYPGFAGYTGNIAYSWSD